MQKNIKRDSVIFAIGGGVVQDISGFIASILFRGIKWYFIPTTILAQCDSCIGGKTSINFEKYKNQLGNFYPPQKIFLDTNNGKAKLQGGENAPQGELKMILVYAPWCGHSKDMLPDYEKVKSVYPSFYFIKM